MTAPEFRDLLKAEGLTQAALAQRLGINISTVNRWAQGSLPVPKYASAYLELWKYLVNFNAERAEREEIASRKIAKREGIALDGPFAGTSLEARATKVIVLVRNGLPGAAGFSMGRYTWTPEGWLYDGPNEILPRATPLVDERL